MLIADDGAANRVLLRRAFSARGYRVDVTASEPVGIADTARMLGADVVLLGVELRRGSPDGMKLIRRLKAGGARVVVIAPVTALSLRAACLAAGADAFASRAQPLDDLVAVVEGILRSDAVLTPASRDAIVRAATVQRAAHSPCAFERLTAKEKLVLIGLMEGRAPHEIAAAWGVSTATVRGHVHSILSKLGARSQLAVIAAAHRAGWPHPRAGTPGV